MTACVWARWKGAAPIDPAQANVPAEWQALPAYLVSAGAELRIVERSRGFAGQDLNRVSVQRDLWRDFDGAGYTFRDRLTGEMQQTWRLDMVAPYELQGARSGQQPLLVTRGVEPGTAGVEWRSRAVDVQATGRLTPSTGEVAASGWNARLTNLGITLHVPPGHRLLAALGVDRAPSAWLDRWQLLDIFMVLLVVTAAFRVAGVTAAVVAGIALLLAHQEQHAITWLFLNLLIAMAIAHAVPEGRFRMWAKVWRNVAFALLGVVLIPFVLTQARIAFFPQLEADAIVVWDQPQPENVHAGAPPAHELQQKVVSGARSGADAAVALDSATATSTVAASSPPAPARLPLYAPGTVLQSGPGVPRWNYGVHRLEWSGPVEPAQTVRLVVLEPLLVSAWRLLACLLLVLLFVVLLRESYAHPRWAVIERWLPRRKTVTPLAIALLAVTFVVSAPLVAHAQTPSSEILQELQQRLRKPPECAPACVSVANATLRATDDTKLEVELEAHAQTRAVLALPFAARHWELESVRIDGNETSTLSRDDAGRVVIGLEPGVHTVTLAWPTCRCGFDSHGISATPGPGTRRRSAVDGQRRRRRTLAGGLGDADAASRARDCDQ